MHDNWTVDKFVWSKDRLSNLSAFINLQNTAWGCDFFVSLSQLKARGFGKQIYIAKLQAAFKYQTPSEI